MIRPPRIPPRMVAGRRIHRGGFQPRTIVVIALAWMLMWDRISWGNAVNGVLIGLLVTYVFPLPSVEYYGRPRPITLVRLAMHFIWSLVVASWRVAVLALRRTPPPRGSIIEVQLRTRSDLYLTIVAVMVALVPGSVAVEVRRAAGTLYVHDIEATDETTLEQRRQAVLDLEQRLVRAIGTPEEIALVEGDGR